MKRIKLKDIFVPKYRTYLLIIFLILLFMCILEVKAIPLAVFVFVMVVYYTYKRRANMIDRVVKNMDSLIFKLQTDETILDFPLPAVILAQTGDVLWNNQELEQLFKGLNKQRYMENLIKELEAEFDTKFKAIDKEISIHDKHFRVLGNLVNLKKKHQKEAEHVLALYFIDRTDYYKLFRVYDDSKDAIGIVMVDNYDELLQGTNDTDKPQLVAAIERKLREWFAFTGGILSKLDRNRFLIIFEKKYVKAFSDSKFEILDSIKELSYSNKIPVTLSIAVNMEEGSKYEKFQGAISALDVVLGRGGDQAVIKKDGKFDFFGGKSKEFEKTTRVKSRVIAQALKELVLSSKNVVVMGHKNMDADALGAAMGIYRVAKAYGKSASIVFNNYGVALKELCERISQNTEYANVLLPEEDILPRTSEETLVVVVDTHKADMVEGPEILSRVSKVVVIDHHRRSTEAIDTAVLTFQEVYASSASELVTEIIQYSEDKIELTKEEAECLYAGILTDTKNFTQKTGVRTFEAAAYLKRIGIDVAAINKDFQTDVDTYVAIADVIRNCEIVSNKVAIAICPKGLENQIQITAQAADELLNLNGIETSFVLCEHDGKVHISGRSNGTVNVQVILEKFGGGGHMMIAGAQVEGKTVEEVKQMIITAVKESETTKE